VKEEPLRVLLVEDEKLLAEAIARGLRREGMAVDLASDGESALAKVEDRDYDIVVLDRDLPVIHGDEICRQVTAMTPSPRVLMLTASGSVDDRVEGLSLGADDYLAKPFAFLELVARIRALGRRPSAARPPILTAGDVLLDPARRTVTRGGRPIPLSRKEFAVLQTLMEAAGAVVSPEDLLNRLWSEDTDPLTNTVRVTVMNVRRKLGDPPVIETIIGSGYRV
jgi:DNA-binding response OmpR family regulator